MKVILAKDIKGTGKKDQIIEVSDGFARNYLLPRKLAVEATDQNLHSRKTAEAATAHRKEMEKDEAVKMAEKLSQATVRITVKAGEKGKLFGSVTTQEIADALRAQYGFDIDKRRISLPEPIRSVGTASAEAKLYAEVSAKLQLEVVAG